MMCVCITVATTVLNVIGRHAARRHSGDPHEDSDADYSGATVLDISGALQRADAGR